MLAKTCALYFSLTPASLAHARRTLAQVLEPLVEMAPVSHPSFYLQVVRMINTLANHNTDSIRSTMKEVLSCPHSARPSRPSLARTVVGACRPPLPPYSLFTMHLHPSASPVLHAHTLTYRSSNM